MSIDSQPKPNGTTVDSNRPAPAGNFPALIERLSATNLSEEELSRELKAVAERPAEARKDLMRIATAVQELHAAGNKDQVVSRLTKQLDRKANAYAVVNELKSYFDCERVSFVQKTGNRISIEAVSGQPTFDRRANTVRKLEKLAKNVLKTNNTFWSEDTENAPQLRGPMDDYAAESNVRSVGVLPLIVRDAGPESTSDDERLVEIVNDQSPVRGQVIGALIVEQMERPLDRPLIENRWNAVEAPVTNTVHNSQQYHSLFMLPVWKGLGKFANLYRGRTALKASFLTIALIGTVVMAVITPADFRVRCEGVIQPREQFPVYAQQDGTISEILVNDGDKVAEGQVLLRQSNPEKEQELVTLAGQADILESTLNGLLYRRSEIALAPEVDTLALKELETETLVTRAELDTVKKQVALVQSQLDSLAIKAPFDGVVFAWNIDRRFQDRPVAMGVQLFTVAKTDSEWELELKVPDTRAGYVQTAWAKKDAPVAEPAQDQMMLARWFPTPEPTNDLTVSYVVTSDPSNRRRGIVRHVPPNLDIDPEQGNVLPVSVNIILDENEREEFQSRPGTSVVGQVHCGQRSLAYCKFYEFVDWSRRKYFEFVQ